MSLLEQLEEISDPTINLSTKDLAKAEPDINDLSDLEDLLSESLRIKKKGITLYTTEQLRKRNKETEQVRFELIEQAEIWERTTCACGQVHTAIFIGYKEHWVGAGIRHWRKVERLSPEAQAPMRYFLSARAISACHCCKSLNLAKLEAIDELKK